MKRDFFGNTKSSREFRKENFFGIPKSSDIFGKCLRKAENEAPIFFALLFIYYTLTVKNCKCDGVVDSI